jgi:hypothetical protein
MYMICKNTYIYIYKLGPGSVYILDMHISDHICITWVCISWIYIIYIIVSKTYVFGIWCLGTMVSHLSFHYYNFFNLLFGKWRVSYLGRPPWHFLLHEQGNWVGSDSVISNFLLDQQPNTKEFSYVIDLLIL